MSAEHASKISAANLGRQKPWIAQEKTYSSRLSDISVCPDGPFACGKCKHLFSKELFRWFFDKRYRAGYRREYLCIECSRLRSRDYHSAPANRDVARKKHHEWRERRLAEGGDRAVRWYFARQIGGYRRRSQKSHLNFDLTIDFLVELFNKQQGLCYYTGQAMVWQGHGSKGPVSDSMSLDRLSPLLGYTRNNVVLCSFIANTSKNSRSELEFYSFCELVLRLRDERQIATQALEIE